VVSLSYSCSFIFFLFSFMLLLLPTSPLFPYTTLFRSIKLLGIHLRESGVSRRKNCVSSRLPQGCGKLGHFQGASECRKHPHRLRSESTRLNSSHQIISYAVFCLKKKKKKKTRANKNI